MILISQNIMGTPAMKYREVLHDLKVLKEKEPDVLCLQEMKWEWYWAALTAYNLTTWGRYPAQFVGAKSSQPILWDKRVWKRIRSKRVFLHDGVAEMTEDRYITCVLLENKKTGEKVWISNRHYLPGAAQTPEGSLRREIWTKANARDRRTVGSLVETGHPQIAVGDYNFPGKVYGDALNGRAVDYHDWEAPIDKVISLNNEGVRVVETGKSVIPNDELRTDHGGRLLRWQLRRGKK